MQTLLDEFDGIAKFNKIEWYVKHAEHVLRELGFAGSLPTGQRSLSTLNSSGDIEAPVT